MEKALKVIVYISARDFRNDVNSLYFAGVFIDHMTLRSGF